MKTATGSTVITNGQIIDGTGAAPIPQGVVVIRDGRLSYVGSANEAGTLPYDAVRIDAQEARSCPA